VLFLVPSISLLQQTLTEWKRETERHMRAYAVCSDVSVGKKQDDTNEIRPYDLVITATTDPYRLSKGLAQNPPEDLTVIFSTYQSISKVSQAQKHTSSRVPEFDLVVCDEAHRTTGVAASKDERSEFLKVHDNDWIKAKKRLYMTATPRIYADDSQKKAAENEYLLASMDDVETYGPTFHRLGFGRAVEQDLLTDYKVLILTVSETMLQHNLDLDAPENLEVSLDDAVKIIGCWNGLAKRENPAIEARQFAEDPLPMRRAVAFSRTIKDSKHVTAYFPPIADQFIESIDESDATRVEVQHVEVKHVDGQDSVLARSHALDWLKTGAPEDDNICRVLSNARCLSEGVDVPSLDAVLFLNPRDSVVDVVQSVGRVMRKSEDKNFGYIILPIPIPANQSPEEALNDNKNYKVVWQVLQALRAHDDRFKAMINTLDLNEKKDKQVKVIGVGGGKEIDTGTGDTVKRDASVQLVIDPALFEQWRDGIYARIVDKVGDRRYWDSWAQDIAKIADTHIQRMQRYLSDPASNQAKALDRFLARLHEEINPAVSREDAIEMLAQHLITRPVFEALFASENFAEKNPVSHAMQQMLDDLGEHTLEQERDTLQKFYRSVRERAANIDNAEGRQKVIVELYDKFFRNAFPKMADRLGIVYTPTEVADYLLHSADHVLREHFGKGLTDEGVHVLDPFTGTGTFITRLLQSGLIRPEDAARKFDHELHANEIVLLAYYIAAVNIESVFQEAFGGEYRPFTGIVWTDTFQMTENEQVLETGGGQFKIMEFNGSVNSERAIRQVRTPIRVIVGNPPYSARQKSTTDDNQNLKYPRLDDRIGETYAARSSASNKNVLYDSYVRAIRWAADRLKDHGVIAFVTNASFIDGNMMDGLRSSLTGEFSSIWVFNARGNARTSGEERQKENGNMFGSGSRSPIALTVLAKDPNHTGPCQLYYHDIGDYLSREDKLRAIKGFGSAENVPWEQIIPNEDHDWIDQRDPDFERFIPLADRSPDSHAIFERYSMGAQSIGDAWLYNSATQDLIANMTRFICTYSDEQARLTSMGAYRGGRKPVPVSKLESDPTRIKWSGGLIKHLERGTLFSLHLSLVKAVHYRPYFSQWLYFDPVMMHRTGITQESKLVPDCENRVIDVTGIGVTKPFSVLMTDQVPDMQMMPNGQVFPLYLYERAQTGTHIPGIGGENEAGLIRHDVISDDTLRQFQEVHNDTAIAKEDIFYYVYGVLHSPEYRERFAADLKKMLPRIPFTEDFHSFSNAGRELGDLHVGYESVEPWPVTEIHTQMPFTADGQQRDDRMLYRVEKMRWGKNGKTVDKSVIKYNDYFTLSDIPLEAYDYIVNGKSAIEWIMERYAITQDKQSKIVNDPNEWSDDPRYIIDLVKRIVRVSMETNRIVASLPALNERDVEIKPRATAAF
jgi:predicted helicase